MTVNSKIDQTDGFAVTMYHAIMSNNVSVFSANLKKVGRIESWPISLNLVALMGFRAKKKRLLTLRLEFEPVTPECRTDVQNRIKFSFFA